jgi:hypothetical protein
MIRTLFAALLLALSLPAAGQPYLVIGIAQVEAKLAGLVEREIAVPIFGLGYHFTENFAVEASYLRLGNYSEMGGTWTAKGPGLAAIGTLPMGRWSLLGKLGFYALDSEHTIASSGGGITTSEDLGNRAVLGIGAAYSLSQHLQVRAMLEQMDGMGELDRLRLFTMGMVVTF